ncbi:MAG TPA: T9SS type A sorting domain-containing protein, partial [Bacteroidia bacterium]|nr:T9SS type A sorting domain-containing protein [Bacteroidia bacterium]
VDLGCTNNIGTNNHKSIDNSTDDNTIAIYPNPGKGLFNVKYAPQGSVIEVYNELGLTVKTIIAGGDDITPVDASNLPNGIYFIRISNTDGSIVSQQKIIKIQ